MARIHCAFIATRPRSPPPEPSPPDAAKQRSRGPMGRFSTRRDRLGPEVPPAAGPGMTGWWVQREMERWARFTTPSVVTPLPPPAPSPPDAAQRRSRGPMGRFGAREGSPGSRGPACGGPGDDGFVVGSVRWSGGNRFTASSVFTSLPPPAPSPPDAAQRRSRGPRGGSACGRDCMGPPRSRRWRASPGDDGAEGEPKWRREERTRRHQPPPLPPHMRTLPNLTPRPRRPPLAPCSPTSTSWPAGRAARSMSG